MIKIRIAILLVLVFGLVVWAQFEKARCPEGGVLVVFTINGEIQQSGCVPDTTTITLPMNANWQRVFIEVETK